MILSGEKKEEYREIKPYYRKRFENTGLLDCHGLPQVYETEIRFKNGYGYTRPWFSAVCSLDIKTGKEEWGAEKDKQYFVLTIREIREIKEREN